MIELRLDQMQHLQNLLRDTPTKIPVVAARAINRAAAAAETQFAKDARQTYNVKYKAVRDSIKIDKAHRNGLEANVKSHGELLNLMSFRVNPKKPQPKRKKPVTASVKKGASTKSVYGFVANVGGRTNVYTRVSKNRLPIKGLYGPSIPQMVGNQQIVTNVTNRATEILERRLEHELNRILGGNS